MRDLAALKILALFGRAEDRDFTDAYDLARRFRRDQLLGWAADDDPGFDKQIFADMLASIERFSDQDLPVQARDASELRAYFPGLGHRTRCAVTSRIWTRAHRYVHIRVLQAENAVC